MSEYSKISKELGWEKRDMPLPTIERANDLVKIAMRKDLDAFRELFKINRFSASPQNEIETESLRIIVSGFIASSKFWN